MPKDVSRSARRPPSKPRSADPDVMRAARAIKAMREGLGLTQRQVAEHHPNDISYQYVAMNENGQVPGIVKPATQREMLQALSAAAQLDPPLTLEDLAAAMARVDQADAAAEAGDPLALRLANAIQPKAERQAVFPTREGDITFTFPADLSPDGFRELEAYFQAFVKANTRSS
jgi:transcriptional regulator with XRE-family HTH domain